jgi:hypothetical protein
MKWFFITFLTRIFIFSLCAKADPGGTQVELAATPINRAKLTSALVGDKDLFTGGVFQRVFLINLISGISSLALGDEFFLFRVAWITQQL